MKGGRQSLRKRMQRGFTMVEVIVAIGMLTLVGLAAAQFAITAVHSSYAHQQRSIAVGLAESGMEQVQESVKGERGSAVFANLTAGMSESGAKEALQVAEDLNVIENPSEELDLGWSASPKATSIQSKVETTDQQGKGTTYTVYTIVGKCYRVSTSASCFSASKLGLVGATGTVSSNKYRYTGEAPKGTDPSADSEFDKNKNVITGHTDFPSGSFYDATGAVKVVYTPMVRVVVLVTWPDSQHNGKTCWYSTASVLDGTDDVILK
ncbi:prepilin-type N-terminal cleavage/methylation domain-containing protein [Bifidobacterium apri]|uniref:type IV pilus modification PilV family protein n=1 Tax=Bifidobacterium apri TaxID=1769423 RepID=UPI0039937F55